MKINVQCVDTENHIDRSLLIRGRPWINVQSVWHIPFHCDINSLQMETYRFGIVACNYRTIQVRVKPQWLRQWQGNFHLCRNLVSRICRQISRTLETDVYLWPICRTFNKKRFYGQVARKKCQYCRKLTKWLVQFSHNYSYSSIDNWKGYLVTRGVVEWGPFEILGFVEEFQGNDNSQGVERVGLCLN